ncbi:alpha/beta fold hydrolase [Arthrobacter sunyaminii]|uniref:alpha/beta fold hydrolase n=1 Tax=Arthrobacter sunyaminii TaxID=2816859 RepID=UPI0030800E11
MYRNLIPLLADRYHVVAPDHLGFGLSDAPSVDEFRTPSTPSPESHPPCWPASKSPSMRSSCRIMVLRSGGG